MGATFATNYGMPPALDKCPGLCQLIVTSTPFCNDSAHSLTIQTTGSCSNCVTLTQLLESGYQDYEIAPLTHRLYAFFWSDFCDWYVEASKAKLQASEALRDNCLAIQDLVIRQFLQLAHPVIPHITEELWQALGYAQPESYIHHEQLNSAKDLLQTLQPDSSAAERVSQLQTLITQGRALRRAVPARQ